jgi:hypothetical protein
MTSRAAPISRTWSRAGNGNSISGSTSDLTHAARSRAIRNAFFVTALTASGALAAPGVASAGSALVPESARPDSAVATLTVETKPPGLVVLVDGVRVGRAPVGPLWVPAKPIRVQALADDPRRFEPGRDTVLVAPVAGQAITAVIDLRPSVLLRTIPEPASIVLEDAGGAGRDSLLGQSPLRLLPSRLERRALRMEAAEHADTTLIGETILALSGTGGPVTVALRRVAPHLPLAPARPPPLYRRRWFQLALIGAGAVLTGTSAVLRHEADRWYDRYLESSDPREIPRFYDRTTHYDGLAGVSLGTGQSLLTAGIFLFVTSGSR